MQYDTSSNHDWILTVRGKRGITQNSIFVLELNENYALLGYHRWVKTQKSTVFIYSAVEAWHA
jgi:hypothetical protein